MMIAKWFKGTPLIKRQLFHMSATQESPLPTKSYRMPQKKQIIPYRTELPLRLHNYKILLFANKQHLYTPALRQSIYAISALTLVYLIKNNPWYLTFPASLPIMIGLELYVFYRWIIHKRHYKYTVERVYLYQNNIIQFVFANKIRRKFKGTQAFHQFSSPIELVKPKQGENGQIQWKERGFPFPTKLIYNKNKQTNQIECFPPIVPLTYGWTKYCENFQCYIFPKHYQYANWQLLVNLFNGEYIDFQHSINQIEQDLPQGEEYYPLEQQLRWIKEDEIKNKEYRRQQLGLQKQ